MKTRGESGPDPRETPLPPATRQHPRGSGPSRPLNPDGSGAPHPPSASRPPPALLQPHLPALTLRRAFARAHTHTDVSITSSSSSPFSCGRLHRSSPAPEPHPVARPGELLLPGSPSLVLRIPRPPTSQPHSPSRSHVILSPTNPGPASTSALPATLPFPARPRPRPFFPPLSRAGYILLLALRPNAHILLRVARSLPRRGPSSRSPEFHPHSICKPRSVPRRHSIPSPCPACFKGTPLSFPLPRPSCLSFPSPHHPSLVLSQSLLS